MGVLSSKDDCDETVKAQSYTRTFSSGVSKSYLLARGFSRSAASRVFLSLRQDVVHRAYVFWLRHVSVFDEVSVVDTVTGTVIHKLLADRRKRSPTAKLSSEAEVVFTAKKRKKKKSTEPSLLRYTSSTSSKKPTVLKAKRCALTGKSKKYAPRSFVGELLHHLYAPFREDESECSTPPSVASSASSSPSLTQRLSAAFKRDSGSKLASAMDLESRPLSRDSVALRHVLSDRDLRAELREDLRGILEATFPFRTHENDWEAFIVTWIRAFHQQIADMDVEYGLETMMCFETVLMRVAMSCVQSDEALSELSSRMDLFDAVFMSKPELRVTLCLSSCFGRRLLARFLHSRFLVGAWKLLQLVSAWQKVRSRKPHERCATCEALLSAMRKLMASQWTVDLSEDVLEEMNSQLRSRMALKADAFDLALFFLKANLTPAIADFNDIVNLF